MRKVLITVMVTVWLPLLLCTAGCTKQDDGPFDVRKVRWGMSQAEVIKNEGKKPTHRDNMFLIYEEEFFEQKAIVAYLFTDNKLWRVIYRLGDMESDDEYAQMYLKIRSSLLEKYGEGEGFDSDLSLYYSTIRMAKTANIHTDIRPYACDTWTRENDIIQLKIEKTGRNNARHITLAYDSKKLAEEAEKARSEEKKEREAEDKGKL